MPKSYSKASTDVENVIRAMRSAHHPKLEKVSVDALFVYDLESTLPVLTHGGYPAAAVVKINKLADRVLGLADARITVDRSVWMSYTPLQRNALIDHELTHLECVYDDETGSQVFDSADRPKLEMRKHDRQFGWFDDVAQRHGKHSTEVRQATLMLAQTDQLYFDFDSDPQLSSIAKATREAMARPGLKIEGTLGDGSKFTLQAGELKAEPDPVYDKAVQFVQSTGKTSISAVQRELTIGYNRAARYLEAMEENGIVTAMKADGKRELIPLPKQSASTGQSAH